MDIQFIGNAYEAAEYTAAYVSKSEPDTIRFRKVISDAVKRCDSNLPNYVIFKKVANATLSVSEVSGQKAKYTLLIEFSMDGKSRNVVKGKS
ncbi:hypothetical protein PHMEG_0007799 [Phytophthora megakarya]|uniref:Uncharacterized protein n=1 Tax=Phytophthora megakarya TaxID=4795 RepID=A0A225WLZ5_9STRA|nr:hypothetical protein PHMEG_0007799 [Phytophthora megakarya]